LTSFTNYFKELLLVNKNFFCAKFFATSFKQLFLGRNMTKSSFTYNICWREDGILRFFKSNNLNAVWKPESRGSKRHWALASRTFSLKSFLSTNVMNSRLRSGLF